MKLYGYAAGTLEPEQVVPSDLAEITLVASPDELRAIAAFLLAAADGMEKRGSDWGHEHLADKYVEFQTSPHFVVFQPDSG